MVPMTPLYIQRNPAVRQDFSALPRRLGQSMFAMDRIFGSMFRGVMVITRICVPTLIITTNPSALSKEWTPWSQRGAF